MEEKETTQLVIVTGFLALYFCSLHIPRFQSFFPFDPVVFFYISLIVGLGSLLFPFFGNGVVYLWYKLAHALGWLNTRIILSLVFYLILLPFALLSRLFRKDPLLLKKGKRTSVYVERNHTYDSADLKNPW